MIESTHPTVTFSLDIADKIIKLFAVLIGAAWTYWHYRKSRTYAQKIELEVLGSVFFKETLYCDVKVKLKNIGATKHTVQHTGTFCEISTIAADLNETSIGLFRVFAQNEGVEPENLS